MFHPCFYLFDAGIVKIGDRRPFYQLALASEEHLIVAIAGKFESFFIFTFVI